MRTHELTDEQKEARRANLAKARAARKSRATAEPSGDPQAWAGPLVDRAALTAPIEMPALFAAEVLDDAFTGAVEEAIAEPVAPTAFELFFSSLDQETRDKLDERELRGIFEASEKKAAELRREQLRKAAADRALHAAKANAGLLPKEAIEQKRWQDYMNEKVTYTPYLPRSGDVGLRIDGQLYVHGVPVTVTRGQYLSHREILFRQQQAEMVLKGMDDFHGLRQNANFLNVGVA